ncbi:MAG: S8 family serine peptidase [Armatimonadetes bacterium]|nr:S8 family serine peptidase [Armatimonadota bacterium]
MLLFGLVALAQRVALEAPIEVEGTLCHPRRLIVQCDSPSTVKLPGGRVLWFRPEIGYACVEVPNGTLLESRASLRKLRGINRVDLDRAARPAWTPNDPTYPNQWNMPAMNMPAAWDRTLGSPNVVVAVLDTGMNSHPDLNANIYSNPGEIAGNGIDDDNNGYIDDVAGWDFVAADNIPNDVQGHGTACAGLVAAVTNNNLGVAGTAPNCKVMGLKVANDSGYFYDSATIPGYIYGANMGCKVFSCSFFSDRVSAGESAAIAYAKTKGVLTVVAAGNDQTCYSYYPAAYEDCLSVAALATNLNKAGFSNFGSWVKVSSPGVSLNTITASGGYTTSFAGTSGSCPQVAGIAALCYSYKPTATVDEVKWAIEDSATTQTQAPFGEFASYGRVNANAALALLQNPVLSTKPTVVRWVNTMPNGSPTSSRPGITRIYGRGLESERSVEVFSAGRSARVILQGRNFIDVRLPSNATNIELRQGGTAIWTFNRPGRGTGLQDFFCTEIASPSGSFTGGFAQTLAADGSSATFTRRSDGSILVHGVFRRVPKGRNAVLNVSRMFNGTTVGTENILLYDWSTNSYPYGSFFTALTGNVPQTMKSNSIPVGLVDRFIDDEGTMYFQITTSTNLPTGTTLSLDEVSLTLL